LSRIEAAKGRQLHTTPIIELQDLQVRLGQQEVLKGISCRLGVLGTGKAIGLLGPNGAGKSTLILTLLGFHKISAGSARVLGLDCLSHSREIKARIGYMPENEAFIADTTAVHFLRIMGELSGLPQRVALEKAHEVLFHVGLGEARYRTLGTYSLGMKQMTKLAQSILHGPEVLILDEPTNGLDPAARLRMLKLIREMKEEHNMSVVLCSHLLRDVEEVCDEVIILNEGHLVHQANLEEERHTNRRFIELEVTGDDGELADALQEQGAEGVNEGNGRWRIVFPPGMELDVLWQLVARQNLAIHHLTHRRDSLEEIFLKAVGHLERSEQSTAILPEKETAHGRL